MTDAPPEDDLPDEFPEDAALELGIDVDEFADEAAEAEHAAGPEPAADEVDFYDAGPDAHALDALRFGDRVAVLERLGPAHFRSKGFSFMGFLQTVYEHVAQETQGDRQKDETPGPESAPEVMPDASSETV